jgi:LPXTG-motif cell wall-anchored protein
VIEATSDERPGQDRPEPTNEDDPMNTHSALLGRATKRLAAVTAAAGLAILGFAAPAAAQTPVPVETSLGFENPIYVGDEELTKGFEASFGDDFVPGAHTVSFSLSIDIADNAFRFSGGDIGDRCTVNAAHTRVDCVQVEADPEVRFEFQYRVHDEAHIGAHPYTVELAVDGEVVHTEESNVRIFPMVTPPDSRTPYAHGDFERTGVAPGSTADVAPEFLQRNLLAPYTKAVVMEFTSSEFARGVTVTADYDNCFDDGWSAVCAVTDFPDDPGTVFTPSAPIAYTVDESVPGPFAICNCAYNVSTVNEEEYYQLFGEFTWDEDSDNLMGLKEAEDPGTEFGDNNWGPITLVTSEHPADLAVDDQNIKGAKGTETTIEIEFRNDGPADTISHPDGPGTFIVLVSLPTGVELNGEPYFCEGPGQRPEVYDHYLPELDPEVIEDVDHVCFFMGIESGETYTVELDVEITANRSASDGTLAVLMGNGSGSDDDLTNNVAKFSLNAKGHGNLPNTGTSLGMIIGAAALVLVAGVVLMVLTARRRKAGSAE